MKLLVLSFLSVAGMAVAKDAVKILRSTSRKNTLKSLMRVLGGG